MAKSNFDRGYKELREVYDEKFGKGKNPGFSREQLAFELTLQDLKECFVKSYQIMINAQLNFLSMQKQN